MVEDIYTLLFDIKAQGGQQVAQQAGTAQKGVTSLNTATANVNKTAGTANKTLNQTANATSSVGKNTASAASGVKNFGAGMLTAGAGIGTMATGIVGLQRSYRDLGDAQGRVDKTQLKLSKATEALNKANLKVKETLKKNGKGSKEYEQALLDQKQAQEQVGIATFNAEEAQEAYNDTQENFKLQILPTVIGLVTTLGGVMGSFSRNAGAATTATNSMAKSTKLLNTALKLSPIFILVGILLAVRNNTFGIRDAFDSVGQKLGAIFPQLTGFLNWVKDLASALGLTGGKVDFGKAFDLLKTGFQGAIDTIMKTDWVQVVKDIGAFLLKAMQEHDWATTWQGFKDALFSTGEWILTELGKIGNSIFVYFSDPKNQAALWDGFRNALFGAGAWIVEQLGMVTNSIFVYFSDPKVQEAIWNGFRTALFGGGAWILEQLGMIVNSIFLYFSDKKNTDAIWNGFRLALFATGDWIIEQLGMLLNTVFVFFSDKKNTDAMWNGFRLALFASADWIIEQLGMIVNAVFVFFSDKKNTDAMWVGFRDAMYAAGTWVGTMLGKIMDYIGKWWGNNQPKLTAAFFDFFDFLYKSALTAGGKIADKIKEGLVNAASTLKKAGEFIWDKISAGLGFAGKTLGQIGDAIAKAVTPGQREGGLIQSAAAGKVFTTRGPTLTLAGDNPGGRETVAYIPHNNPMPTLEKVMKVFGHRGFTSGNQVGLGRGTMVLHIYVQVGGKTTEEIIQQVETGLGQNFRSIR